MKTSLKGTSIIEAMVVMLIVTSGIVGVFGLMDSGQKLSNSTAKRIEAIQIARDGIESFTNIRDTNWTLFAADYKNCWNTLNYNSSCIGDTTASTDIVLNINEAFAIFKNLNKQFELVEYPSNLSDYSDSTYRTNFRVQKDAQGFYTQSGGIDFSPIYTREIQIDYLQADNSTGDSNDPKMQVTVIVQWNDVASDIARKLEMKTLLTNWKESN